MREKCLNCGKWFNTDSEGVVFCCSDCQQHYVPNEDYDNDYDVYTEFDEPEIPKSV